MNTTDRISFGGLIVTIITGVVFPFIQKPMLDYSYYPENIDKNSTKDLTIKIRNFGFAPARHVVSAMKGGNVSLSKLRLNPFYQILWK